MAGKDYTLYGTKILNLKTQEIGLLICLWGNRYADKTVDFATCVDKTGKRTILSLIISEGLKMILKNKLTKETLDIPYSEFRKKFAKEIQDAFESYRKTQLNKYSWNFKDDNSLEFNFYFELHWNFNHFGMSNWFIEKL